ncbi:hypothetical protein PR001_g23783 [Phytophthora rubi]|uniref:Uncharacterized protein n=1 Tax=Phytophthora rubi TaxID=129364 RepID=A0A6A3IKS9_9STRA|nr:hypothetical protein PR001_g23783 [Phytophthora rubi]
MKQATRLRRDLPHLPRIGMRFPTPLAGERGHLKVAASRSGRLELARFHGGSGFAARRRTRPADAQLDKSTVSFRLARDAHREVYCKLNAGSCRGDEEAADVSSPNFDLVPSVDDDKVICGAPIAVIKPATTSKTIQHAQADKVVDEWLEYTVDWVPVACRCSADENKSKDDFTPLMLVRRNGVVCWRVRTCRHPVLVP